MTQPNSMLQAGVLKLNPELMLNGLHAGANINIALQPSLLSVCEVLFIYSEDGFHSKKDDWGRCVDIALGADPKLDQPNAGSVFKSSHIDRIISTGYGHEKMTQDPIWVDKAACAVIETLAQNAGKKQTFYDPNFDEIFSGIGDEVIPTARSSMMDTIERVHDRVAERLCNPESAKDFILVPHEAALAFWRQPFDRPDIDTLARPSQALVDAFRHFYDSRDVTYNVPLKDAPGTLAPTMSLRSADPTTTTLQEANRRFVREAQPAVRASVNKARFKRGDGFTVPSGPKAGMSH